MKLYVIWFQRLNSKVLVQSTLRRLSKVISTKHSTYTRSTVQFIEQIYKYFVQYGIKVGLHQIDTVEQGTYLFNEETTKSSLLYWYIYHVPVNKYHSLHWYHETLFKMYGSISCGICHWCFFYQVGENFSCHLPKLKECYCSRNIGHYQTPPIHGQKGERIFPTTELSTSKKNRNIFVLINEGDSNILMYYMERPYFSKSFVKTFMALVRYREVKNPLHNVEKVLNFVWLRWYTPD